MARQRRLGYQLHKVETSSNVERFLCLDLGYVDAVSFFDVLCPTDCGLLAFTSRQIADANIDATEPSARSTPRGIHSH